MGPHLHATATHFAHPSHDRAPASGHGLVSDPIASAIAALATSTRKVRKGQMLFSAGMAFESLYVLRLGWMKSVLLKENSAEQITGFPSAGALLGLDGIATDRHTTTVVALEDCEVYVVPFRRICEVGRSDPDLADLLARAMSQEIVTTHRLMFLLGNLSADQRVKFFMAQISARLAAMGYSSSTFVLRMTREDIGCYLGLNIETVSRTLTRLCREGVLSILNHREIRLVRPLTLRGEFPPAWFN